MQIIKIFLCLGLVFFTCSGHADDLFAEEPKVQQNINVNEVSEVFADIYEKLDSVNWAGKNIEVAIESLEKLNPKAHIAATGERVVLVWGDKLIANFPYPKPKDWKEYGQITTKLILNMREQDENLRALKDVRLYQVVVNALLSGIDENGTYVHNDFMKTGIDPKMLTSLGVDGGRDERGNFRITGVFKNSPADMSGMNEGDIISEINGKRVSEMRDRDLFAVLAGYNSGTVKVKLLTPFGNKNITLRRATIVSADADIVYRAGKDESESLLEIIIHEITDGAVNIVNEALAKYKDINGIILDLRAGGGNDERAAAKLAGLFLGQNPVMIISETAVDELEVVPGGDAVTDVPVVVLMSDSTHGTAEAIASAFYENKRGLLVGTPTAGKSRIASRIELKNGAVLELFNKSIKTGSGNVLDGRGMFPLICLSNIRNTSEREAFFLNVINDDFDAHDYNQDKKANIKSLRKACPVITSGTDEDAVASAVSAEILTNKKIYSRLMGL